MGQKTMTLIIETPDTRGFERYYILNVLLGEFLGLSWQRVPSDRTDSRITLQGHAGEILMPDILLQTPDTEWLTPNSLPAKPLPVWNINELGMPITLIDKRLPIIYGDLETVGSKQWPPVKPLSTPERPRACFSGQAIVSKHKSAIDTQKLAEHGSPTTDHRQLISLPIDIFGSAFFMLTRYEEIVKPERDQHDRFPARASLAYQENFLDRPIIDEYVEVLWAAMKSLWPGLERKKSPFRIFPTHDVDDPFDPSLTSFKKLILSSGADVLKRKSLKQAAERSLRYVRFKKGKAKDPFNTFDWLMLQSERLGVPSAFYFKAAKNGRFDSEYSLNHPRIQALFQEIGDRGHEIGFHPGYWTYLNKDLWHDEYQRLTEALPKSVSLKGGRQHFLRFSVPETWRKWADAGLEYDTSMGYADHAGFRCGTCRSFPVFDLRQREQLNIVERPLIAMECSVLDSKYMGMQDFESAVSYMLKLKNHCSTFGGEFVFLWHNSRLTTSWEKRMYQAVLGVDI